MKKVFGEILGEFYEAGLPEDLQPRRLRYLEKRHSASVLVGMRRTGKTYAAFQRMLELRQGGVDPHRLVYINFEDDRLKRATLEDLHLIGELHAAMFPEAARQMCWYFLDELQTIDGWELYARRLIDSNLVQLCLTGSSARLLSSEIATQMRGRALEMEVFPLSFPEMLTFNGIFSHLPVAPFSTRTAGMLRHAMARYFEEGGFPDTQDCDRRARVQILQGYVDAVVYRDIIERHSVPSVPALRYTLDYLLSNYARKVSTRAIAGALKANGLSGDREVISEYLRFFRDAYLAYSVPLRTDSLTVRAVNPDKYYLVDTGLIRAMTPKNDEERGWLLENLVFLVLRRGFCKIEYYNVKGGGEVDFYVTDRLTREARLVQVAWEMSRSGTLARELSALRRAMQETGVRDGVVVTWDDEWETDDGIRVVPIWKWALAENGGTR